MPDAPTWLRWTILVLVIGAVSAVALGFTAKAVGGWRELRARQYSYGVPTRYLVGILPFAVFATIVMDPTKDRHGLGWVSRVATFLTMYLAGQWVLRKRS